jgi:hypothetical protein
LKSRILLGELFQNLIFKGTVLSTEKLKYLGRSISEPPIIYVIYIMRMILYYCNGWKIKYFYFIFYLLLTRVGWLKVASTPIDLPLMGYEIGSPDT